MTEQQAMDIYQELLEHYGGVLPLEALEILEAIRHHLPDGLR